MKAYDLLDAWNDSANTDQVPLSAGKKAVIADLQAYADGAFDISLSSKVAGMIYDCLIANEKAENGELEGYKPGEFGKNWWQLVELPLQGVFAGSLYDNVMDFIKDASESEKIQMWNEYAREKSRNEIMRMDEISFDDLFTNMNDVARAVYYGDFNFGDDYMAFNDEGNLDTFASVDSNNSPFVASELADWLCDTGKYADYFPELADFSFEDDKKEKNTVHIMWDAGEYGDFSSVKDFKKK